MPKQFASVVINGKPLSDGEVMTIQWALTNLEMDILKQEQKTKGKKKDLDEEYIDRTDKLYLANIDVIRKKMK
jgi:hypothetical protein